MDDHQRPPPHEGTLAEKTTRALETLRERADGLRADEATQWSQIETRLMENLQAVSEELGRGWEAFSAERASTESQSAELASRETELTSRETELTSRAAELTSRESELTNRDSKLASREAEFKSRESEYARHESELESRTAKLADRELELSSRDSELAIRESDLTSRETEFANLRDDCHGEQRELAKYLQDRQDQLNLHEQELDQRMKLLEQTEQSHTDIRQQLEADRESLEHTRQRFGEKEVSLERQREQFTADREHLKEQRRKVGQQLAEQRKKQRCDIEQERSELDHCRAKFDHQQIELQRREQENARREAELIGKAAALDTRDDEQAEEIGRLHGELTDRAARVAELETVVEANNVELAELRETNGRLETDLAVASDTEDQNAQTVERLSALQEQHNNLATERDTLRLEIDTAHKELESVTTTRDRLAAALAETEEKLEQAAQQLAIQPDTSELQRKFELAMEEARNLRATNAELAEEMASRPEAESGDSQEILDLQSERHALVERIAELERESAADTDPTMREQFDDLQKRFELAVEDIRSLKNEKAELERRLADVGPNVPVGESNDGDGLDWESMKRRLLMSLDDDFNEDDEEDQRERSTIEGTIQITDEVIAQKDKEVTELKQLLEEQSDNIGEVAVGAGAVAGLFDQDDAIRLERERLKELQVEWEEKLRQAELEFSVQRAKFARDKTALEQKQREIEEARADLEEALKEAPEAPTAPAPNAAGSLDSV